ncbi:MAG: TonB-dependent receptor [Woeseiaceae bacterium]|nr:TonB-dependent receptor [Woeseiaceae bacterium]
MKLIRIRVPALARLTVAAALSTSLAVPALAQSDLIFEEIVVRAQKREQNIMDVPVAVTAVTGAQIEASGIKDVFDLQQNVPGLIVGRSQTATTSNFSIRSVGSTSNNFGVESSVGLYVDGVYRSRQSSIINELIDVEAVEVLRGPQGTLFGKNTPSGAIQIRTVAPGPELGGFFEATAGDLGLARISGAANIPMSDALAFRGTVFSSRRDGYVDDISGGSDLYNDRDRFGLRAQLAYAPDDSLNVRVIADYSEIDELCCAAVSRVDNLYSRASISGIPQPGTDALLLAFGGTVFTDFPYPQPLLDALAPLPGTIVTGVGFDDYTVAYNTPPTSKNEDAGVSLDINYTLDNGVTLTSVSAFRAFDTLDSIDADFTNVPLLTRVNDATLDSFSQEFRIAGEFGESSNYVVGFYYFEQEINNVKTTSDPALLSAFFNNNPDFLTIAAGVDAVAAQAGPPYQPAGIPALPGNVAVDDTTHDQDGYAVFGQVDFALGESFIFTLGARYTDESKDTVATYTQSLPANQPRPNFGLMGILLCSLDPACAATLPPGLPTFDPVASFPVFQPFFIDGWATFAFDPLAPRSDINESIEDDQTTGTAKLTWFAGDNAMLYASYSTGFKSGGINDDRINPAFPQSFGPETSESIEVGFKGDIGPVRLAVSLYDTDYEDFQANAFTGTGFNLQNAGDLSTQGIEVEFVWRPFDTFEVAGHYSHNEGEYDSFIDGTCWDATPFHTGVDDPGLPPAFNPLINLERCDRSGNVLAYNPEDRLFLGFTKDFPFGDNNVFVRAEWAYYSEQFTDGDLDPLTEQDEVNIVNLRLGVDFDAWNSTLTLWGRNITDERYYAGSFDAPAQDGRMNSYPAEPSTFGVTFQKRFD